MHQSGNAFLNAVLYAADKCPSIVAKSAGKHRAGTGRAVSQGGKFKKQLDELMHTLKSCQSHYIRCIKPNSKKLPNMFEGLSALQQLRYSGVFEAVIIRKQGYPFRMLHSDFYARYKALIPRHARTVSKGRSATGADCKLLLDAISKKPGVEVAGHCKIGKTMVLWRATENRPLSLAFALVMQAGSVLVQKLYRRHLAKLEVTRMKELRKVLISSSPSPYP
jgi:myosin heavy subunit